jgi:hypothetical protein
MALLPTTTGRYRWLVLSALSLLAITLVLAIGLVGAAAVVGGGPSRAGRGACVSVAEHPVCYLFGHVPSTVSRETRSHADRLYGRVVSTLALRRTRVYCWSQADWSTRLAERAARWPHADPLGPWRAFAQWTPRSVHLSPEICAQLARVVAERDPVWKARSVDALAWSVHALAHESVHASGIPNEALAECYGLQATAEVATRLGRTRDEGRYLAAVYWKHWYVWAAHRYHSAECRDGGRLDVHKGHRWP